MKNKAEKFFNYCFIGIGFSGLSFTLTIVLNSTDLNVFSTSAVYISNIIFLYVFIENIKKVVK